MEGDDFENCNGDVTNVNHNTCKHLPLFGQAVGLGVAKSLAETSKMDAVMPVSLAKSLFESDFFDHTRRR